jgi:glycosyltransferase involved in cell wall biosynthesis
LRAHGGEYDAVVTHGLWQYHGFAVWLALRNQSTPYFVYPHGMLDPWFKQAYPLKHLKKWLYWPWAEYRVLRDARAVLFTCEDEKMLAAQSFWLYRCHGRVPGFGITNPSGPAGVQRNAFYIRFPELVGKRILLFLGRIHPKKGCDLLLEAFAAVAHTDPALRLVFAGPDRTGWQPRLEARALELGVADRVTWAGMLSGDAKWGAFRAADAFALTSHQENFGVAVAEALACGVPVLISDKVNIWREIEAYSAGIVAPDDLAGAQSLLRRWTKLPAEVADHMRSNALACFERRFQIDAVVERLVAILQELPPQFARSVIDHVPER